MSSVGTYLRELRQRKGVSLEEIARTTRVAQRYLESLEADDFDALPSPVFTRGFIRAYCQALSEPPEEALAAYEGHVVTAAPPTAAARPGAPGAPRPASHAPRPATYAARTSPGTTRAAAMDGEPRGKGAVLVSFILLVVLGVALFAVALVIHPRDRSERVVVAEPRPESRPVRPPGEPIPTPAPPATSMPSVPSQTPSMPSAPVPSQPTAVAPRPTPPAPPPASSAPAPAAPATSGAAQPGTPPPPAPRPAPAAPPAPTVAPSVPAAASTPPAAPAAPATPPLEAVVGSITSPYRLVARTNEATWIRVRTEDGRMSEENVPPNEVREWISNRPFTLTIGNAGGVSLELNGRVLPPLGPKGAVIQRIVLPPEAR